MRVCWLRRFHSLKVVYGSQTGTAQMFASQLAESVSGNLKWEVDLKGLDEVKAEDLFASKDPVAVVCSVFGEGEPPDNAKSFFASLLKAAPASYQGSGAYGVFGLGDSRYASERFNVIGRSIDDRMSRLGKERLLPFVAGDAAHDIEHDFEVWSAEFVEKLKKGLVKQVGKKEEEEDKQGRIVRVSANEVSYYRAFDASLINADNPALLSCVMNRSVLPNPKRWNERPCQELLFSGSASVIPYVTGDYFGVYPPARESYVEELVSMFALDQGMHFVLEGYQSAVNTRRKAFPKPISVGDFLRKHCDLQRVIPTNSARKLLKWVSSASDAARISEALEEKQGAFRLLFWFKSVPDVLKQFPSLSMSFGDLVEFLPASKPSYYSIASSSLARPNEIRLVVNKHVFGSMEGLCSTFLTQKVDVGTEVEGFVKSSVFKLPADPQTPIIMIGVGSGIAPFLAFMEERVATKSTRNHLFFGCMRPEWDLLYAEQLSGWAAQGALNLHVAFSHSDPSKMVFCQHLMLEREEELWNLIHREGAHVYVCGHTRLGAGVESAMHEIVLHGLKGDAEATKQYLNNMMDKGRIKLDVFA